MPRPRPPFLHCEINRHGSVVWYVRRGHGHRVRLRAAYGSDEFWEEYRVAMAGAPVVQRKSTTHTLGWALEKYARSSAWSSLSAETRRQRSHILHKVMDSAGHSALSDIDKQTILDGRERRAATPHAANSFIKAMRSFCRWCVENGYMATDPTKEVRLLVGPNDADGFHTWTPEEVARFEAYWKVGTRERLAFDLLFYTGLRRGDAVRVGRQHVKDDEIEIRTEKHARGKAGELITLPILSPLAASINATKTGDMTFLVNERGTPWVKESFGNWFRDICRKANCPGSAHGLRKAGATRAAEHGASEKQLMAMFGWSTGKQAAHYTRAADRRRLAKDAAVLLLPVQPANKKRPHLASGAGTKSKVPGKSGD